MRFPRVLVRQPEFESTSLIVLCVINNDRLILSLQEVSDTFWCALILQETDETNEAFQPYFG